MDKINNFNKKSAFTLTEMLLAIGIVGIISALVLPAVITSFQNNIFKHAYDRETHTISELVDQLSVQEGLGYFNNTIMYLESEPESYEETSGVFLKKYFKVSKYCGDTKTGCFAPKYYKYEGYSKKTYSFTPKGSCAILKNGMSICVKPQIKGEISSSGKTIGITGWIDLNGKKEPNVLDRDLRKFSIEAPTKYASANGLKPVLTYCNDSAHPEHKTEKVCNGKSDPEPEPEV